MKSIKFFTLFIAFFGLGFSLLIQSCKASKTGQTTNEVAKQADIDLLYNSLAKGGDIKLKKLVYYLDNPLMISNKNDLSLDGNGSSFIMKNKSEDVLIVENSQNITLKNFKATHIEPDGPIGCTGSVIQVRDNNGVSIEKCELNGSGIIGVTSYNTKNLSVIDNYIYNNSEYGILYDKDTSIEIKGNKFEDNGKSGKDHVVKALNAFLSEVEKIEKDMNKEGLKMSQNIFN